jgi:assimilatory nitrate reductase catalytic subunit
VLVGANPAETMPPLARYLTEQSDRGGELIVVDPRRTATAKRATLHLQPTPGTDLALANALLHLVIADGHVDRDFVECRTTGFDDVSNVVASYWPERVERMTGVSVADLRATVELLAGTRRVVIVTARGAEQHSKGTDTVSAWINLALALGLPGRTGSGYGCLTGQGNGQGGREHGQKADQLPATGASTTTARAHVAPIWGVAARRPPRPGRLSGRASACLGEPAGPKALLVFGSNPWCRRPGRGSSSGGWAHWICSWSPTSSCPRRRLSPTWCCPPRNGPRRTGR